MPDVSPIMESLARKSALSQRVLMDKLSELLPAAEVDAEPGDEAALGRKRTALRRQCERVAEIETGVSRPPHRMPCACGKSISIVHMYRCRHCGFWLCTACATRHFTTTEAAHG